MKGCSGLIVKDGPHAEHTIALIGRIAECGFTRERGFNLIGAGDRRLPGNLCCWLNPVHIQFLQQRNIIKNSRKLNAHVLKLFIGHTHTGKPCNVLDIIE